MKRLGAAVIGCGMYGEVHARTYASDPRVDLAAVWSRSKARAQVAAAKYGARPAATWDEIAADDDVQIASIATPDFAHVEPALAMLRAGKHVLLEKPMAMTSLECERIVAAARATGAILMVNFHNRWHPPFARAKALIGASEIGSPVSGYFRLSDRIEVATEWLPWAGRSGPEWFLMPHIVDLARWLIGREPTQVSGMASRGVLVSRGIECYDTVQAQVDFEGVICSFESSWILPTSFPSLIDFQVQVQGTRGRIDIAADQEQLRVSGGSYRTPLVLDFIAEEQPIRHFVDCVVEGREPACGGEDGVAATRVIEGVMQSVRERRVVTLDRVNDQAR